MTATALVITSAMRMASALMVAVASALALLVTVKSVLYLPVFPGALTCRCDGRDVVLALTCVWHASALVVAPGNDTASNARSGYDHASVRADLPAPKRHRPLGTAWHARPARRSLSIGYEVTEVHADIWHRHEDRNLLKGGKIGVTLLRMLAFPACGVHSTKGPAAETGRAA